MWDWINLNTVVIFGGLAAFAYFGERAVAALAHVFTREWEERDE